MTADAVSRERSGESKRILLAIAVLLSGLGGCLPLGVESVPVPHTTPPPPSYSKRFVVYDGLHYRDLAITYRKVVGNDTPIVWKDTLRSEHISPVFDWNSSTASFLDIEFGPNRDTTTWNSPFVMKPGECPVDSSSAFCPGGDCNPPPEPFQLLQTDKDTTKVFVTLTNCAKTVYICDGSENCSAADSAVTYWLSPHQ